MVGEGGGVAVHHIVGVEGAQSVVCRGGGGEEKIRAHNMSLSAPTHLHN